MNTTMFTGADLMGEEFPELRYVIDGIIPEGLTLLTAAPKIGKSWLALSLALATSSGGTALGGIQTRRAPVLYLALEDGRRRLQDRIRRLGVTDVSADLFFMTEVNRVEVLDEISDFMRDKQGYGTPPLVIIDTLAKIMRDC